MGTNTMIPVPASLTCGYKKYLYLLPASIHLQYIFPTHCGFYLRIPAGTDFFDIPNWVQQGLIITHIFIFHSQWENKGYIVLYEKTI